MDNKPINLSVSPSIIEKSGVGTISLYGIWDLAPYSSHSLKIQNGVTSTTKTVVSEPRKDDLVGGWDFDDGSGTSARDWSGKGNTGTLLPAGSEPTWTNGKMGGGLKFDGSNDYARVPNSASFTTTRITVSAWVYTNNFPSSYSRIAQDGWSAYGSWSLMRENLNNRNMFGVAYNGATQCNRIGVINPLGQWVNYVGVYNSTNVLLYENGVYIGNSACSSLTTNLVLNNTANTFIGSTSASSYFNGTIDDVRIYSKALTPDELVNLKAA